MEGHGGGGRQVESKLSPGDSVWDPQEDRRVAAQVRSRGGHHDDGRAKGLGADGGGGGGVDCCGDGRGSFGQIQTSDLHHAKGNATEAAALRKGFVLHADRAEPMFPPRPGYGAAGTPCVVRANLFFSRLADQGVHYYSLTISPEPTFKYDYGEVMSKLVLEHQHTDLGGRLTTCNGSSSLITLGKLPFDTKEFEVTLSGDKGKETNYRVVVKHVMAISLLQLRMLLGCYPRDIQDME